MADSSLPAPKFTLSQDEARHMVLRAQGLLGSEGRRGGVLGMLRRLGAVQLDTISVLARSHELVAYARLGPVGRDRVERAYWHPRTATAFEYWSHAACVLPVEEWPYYAFRRRAFRAKGLRWHQSHPEVCDQVLARIRGEGPLTATELGGAKRGGPWWDWSDTKIAVEWLLDTGDVICARRSGWRRVYDLPERVLPAAVARADPGDAECVARLAEIAARALGVVTQADLTDYQRLSYRAELTAGAGLTAATAAEAAGLIPVEIAAARRNRAARDRAVPAWAHPAALESPGEPGAARRGRHRTTLLSPFDSLVWDRKRTLRVFGFEHSLEAYVPPHKRVHGYFTMPLLAGGKLVGRVDPAREGSTLVARTLSLDRASAAEPMARALVEAASWVGCDSVRVERAEPAGLEPRLRAALVALGS